MENRIFITSKALLTPAGLTVQDNWGNLIKGQACFKQMNGFPTGQLSQALKNELLQLKKTRQFRDIDEAVVLAFLAAEICLLEATFDKNKCGTIIGSSRGATNNLETSIVKFYSGEKIPLKTSPTTTSGNFATFVAQQLGLSGIATFLSSACATGIQAIGIGYSLIKSGMLDHVLVGTSEYSNTPYTLEMLKNVNILSKLQGGYPLMPLHSKRSGMVLSEGAAAIILEKNVSKGIEILGFGSATEMASATGISDEATSLQQSINQALNQANLRPDDINLIIGHGSGTVKGDQSEYAGIKAIFGKKHPPLTFHKWLTGHMLSVSSMFSVIMGMRCIEEKFVPGLPYFRKEEKPVWYFEGKIPKLKNVLVLALGFGGQATALIISEH